MLQSMLGLPMLTTSEELRASGLQLQPVYVCADGSMGCKDTLIGKYG